MPKKRDPLKTAAMPFGIAAALVLLFMMVLTCYEVLSRKLFGHSIFGLVDIMEISLVACIFVALPGIFLRDENVVVDAVDQVTGPRTRKVLRVIGVLLSLGFLIVVLVTAIPAAVDKLTFPEFTMTLAISRFWHWVPILFGLGVSTLACLAVLFFWYRRGVPDDPTLKDADTDMGEKEDWV